MLARIRWIELTMILILLVFASCKDQTAQQPATTPEITAEYADAPLPQEERKRVFVLHSYHEDYTWLEDVNKGILSGLAEERFIPEKNIAIEHFYMDTKNKTSQKWIKEVSDKAMERIRSWKPDVVIATDDNAQKYVVAKMKDSGVNFVFLGVNADPLKYGYINSQQNPGGSVTGSIERARFEQTMQLLKKLKPGVNRIAIVSDDGSTSDFVINRVLDQAIDLGIEVVASRRIGDFSEWKEYVLSVQDRADALLVGLYFTLKDDTGKPVSGDEVLSWTIANSNLPDIGFWSWAVEGGLLCSEAISGYQQGHYAATVASYVLAGQSPGDFPVDKPQRGEITINLARAKMLGIEVPNDLQRIATVFNSIGAEKGSK